MTNYWNCGVLETKDHVMLLLSHTSVWDDSGPLSALCETIPTSSIHFGRPEG